jgi:hypothetical protein
VRIVVVNCPPMFIINSEENVGRVIASDWGTNDEV